MYSTQGNSDDNNSKYKYVKMLSIVFYPED